MERVTPHDMTAEQAVLGAMLLSDDVQNEAAGYLEPDDFYHARNRAIFSSMRSLTTQGKMYDVTSLADKLKSDGTFDAIGGHSALIDVTAAVTTTALWKSHADIVKRLSVYRKVITAAENAITVAYSAPEDVQESVGKIEQSLLSVTHRSVEQGFTTVADALPEAFSNLENIYNHDGVLGVATGFPDFDGLTGGLKGGELAILAARPAMGKTALALNMAVNAAKRGTPVAIFSLEMSQRDLVQRVLCSEATVSIQQIKNRQVGDDDWNRVATAMSRLSALPLVIDDTPSLNITELRAKATRHFREKGKGLIVVDYLQLMSPTNKKQETRQTEISEISRGLKILAKDLDVPIIALSQLSRAIESRQNRTPQLSDLRESGAIEQDADIVMFIDRSTEGDTGEGRPPAGCANLIIGKHRNGPTGRVRLIFREMYTKFLPYGTTENH